MNLVKENKYLVPFESLLEVAGMDWPDVYSIMGYDTNRGTNEFADVITQSADGASLADMWREFQTSVSILNRQRNPLVNMLTYDVSSPTERVLYPASEDFEEATEFGEPKGIRLGTPIIMGFDFKWYDLAQRFTWLFLAESSADQIRAINATALEADNRLVFTKIFKRIFANTNSTADVNGQNVNVYSFWNNDGILTPPPYKGTTFLSTHTHYLSSGAANVDNGDLVQLEDTLYEHGYRGSLGYQLVLMVNRQEGKIIRALKVATSASYDFIPSSAYGGGVFIPANGGIVARPSAEIFPGEIGTWGPFIVVEEDYIPAGWVFAFATGGERNINNPVGYRQHDVASLRGLRLVGGIRDYPLTDSYYQHGFGTGVRHRGAGVVMKITAGAYSVPPAYV